MSEADFWSTIRRALRQYAQADCPDQRLRAYQTIMRAVEKFCPEKVNSTEPNDRRAVA